MISKKNALLCLGLTVLSLVSVLAQARSNNAGAVPATDRPDGYEAIYDRTIKNATLEQYYDAINGGWSPGMAALRKQLKPKANYLVIHAQEPKEVMDLRSVDNFKRAMESKGILNMTNNSLGIGHTIISWRCQEEEGPEEGTVGMTGELSQQFMKLFESGHGLAAFMATYTDGHLQTPELLEFDFNETQPLHSLAIEVSLDVCRNAQKFVWKFLKAKNEPYNNFGLALDPAKFEGGGCGSFGTTVLQKSGIFGEREIIPSFWRTLRANPNLFGYGLDVPADVKPYEIQKTGTRFISKLELFSNYWNSSTGPAMNIMDPEMLLLFLKTVYRTSLTELYESNAKLATELKNSDLYKIRFIKEDLMNTSSRNSEDFAKSFATDTQIDSNFDAQAADVVRNTRAWTQSLRDAGYRARAAYVGNPSHPFVGVIIDK